MKSGRHLRALMLGWEYPPRFAGGLGKACQGLSQALARQGVQLYFVLPTFPERVSEPRLEVVGAREVLIEAGWELDPEAMAAMDAAARSRADGRQRRAQAEGPPGLAGSRIEMFRSEAVMFPYGAHPAGQPSGEGVRRLIERMVEERVEPPRKHEALRRALRREKPGGARRSIEEARKEAARSEIYGRNLWSEIERFCFTVRHMAEAHEVDLVHAHDWMTFPAAFEFQRVTGVPVFLHVHATEYDRSGENVNNDVFRIEREGFRRATHIFAVSRYTAGIIERLYGVNRRKISVVYNAPEEGSRELLASPDSPRQPQVVFLGRLTFQKGPDHFLRAAALVSRAHPAARFIFCGTGDMMEKLRAYALQMGIEKQVHFAGFVDPSGVDRILAVSRVLVMPSVSEPFGLVALEAIRCGIPVIISKQSGVREVLPRALQVDFWDHEKLADQMLAALRLPDLSRQLVHEGMDQLRELSWEKSARKVIHSYRQHVGSTYAQAIGGAHGH